MANNVKFFRLGINTPVSFERYRALCNANPGAMIFARVMETEGKDAFGLDSSAFREPGHYIWANGLEYKVPSADALQAVIDAVNTLNADEATEGSVAKMIKDALDAYKPKAEDILELIDASSNVKVELVDSSLRLTVEARKATITEGAGEPEDEVENPGHGDYYVKVVELADGSDERTAYIYDEEVAGWVALDGNVDAEHVIINKDITLSGNYETIGNMSRGDVVTAGTTVKSLFDSILALEVYPEDLEVVYTFTSSNSAPTLNVYKVGTTTASPTSVEVGTMVDVKASFGTQSATEKVEAKTFNNGTDKGYSTDKTEATYVNAETYTEVLSDDVAIDDSTSKLTITVGGKADAATTTTNYELDASIGNVVIKEGVNTFDAKQTAATYTRDWANLTEETLYAKSNIDGYSDEHAVSISKTDAEAATTATTKAADKSASQKKITGYWPIYWGYITEGAATFDSTTFTVDWIQANYEGKESSFSLPTELSTLAPTDAKKCYGIWVAIPADQAAATATWNVNNKATAAPVNMATDSPVSVNGMTSTVAGTTYTGTKNYKVQYWVNADYDYAANTYSIAKA